MSISPSDSNQIKLVRPSALYKKSYLEGLAEFQAEGLAWVMDLKIEDLSQSFEGFVQSELSKKTLWTKDTPVDETELWAIDHHNEFAGRISIRHRLNADLLTMGGHIGYDTRPSRRGRGVASAMLSLSLPIAKQLGLTKALLTCNDGNVASIKIIEKHGGMLAEKKPQFEGGPLKRYYWIHL